MERTGIAVAVFLFHDDNVLLTKHKKHRTWLPPGGHVDDGEMLTAALTRELREETGLTARFVRSPSLPGIDDAVRLPIPISLYRPKKASERTREILTFVGVVDDLATYNPDMTEFDDIAWLALAQLDTHSELTADLRERVRLAWQFLQERGVA